MKILKNQFNSKTNVFFGIVGIIEAVAASLTYWEPVLTEAAFQTITTWVATISPIAGILLRQITKTAISDKTTFLKSF